MSWILNGIATYLVTVSVVCFALIAVWVVLGAVWFVISGIHGGRYKETALISFQAVILIAVLDVVLGLIFGWSHVESLYQNITEIFPGMTRLALFMIIMELCGVVMVLFTREARQEMAKDGAGMTAIIVGSLLWCLYWWKMPAVFEAWGFSNAGWPGSMWPEIVEWGKGMLISLVGIFQSLFSLQIISVLVSAVEFFFISWEFGLLVIGVEFFTQEYINLWGAYEAVNNFFDVILEILPL